MNNVVLVGMMGSGKSTVGHGLSVRLNMTFMDTDENIESSQQKTISQIFNDEGESYFRELETAFLKKFRSENVILSTGGGMVIKDENRELLRRIGKIIYLKGSEETLYTRLITQTEHRPLLDSNVLANQIHQLLTQRSYFYENTADYIVNIDGKEAVEVIEEIIGFLKD